MNYFIFCLLILMCLLYLYIFATPRISTNEHYDTTVPKDTLVNCAKKCKENINCAGFGFDPILKNCYLSRTTIGKDPRLDPTIKYGINYRPDHVTCNKIFPYIEGETFEELRNNSLFTCSKIDPKTSMIDKKYDKGTISYYIQRFDRLDLLGEGVNIDTIFDIDKYTIDKTPL